MECRPRPPQIALPKSENLGLIRRFKAPITDVVMPEESQIWEALFAGAAADIPFALPRSCGISATNPGWTAKNWRARHFAFGLPKVDHACSSRRSRGARASEAAGSCAGCCA